MQLHIKPLIYHHKEGTSTLRMDVLGAFITCKCVWDTIEGSGEQNVPGLTQNSVTYILEIKYFKEYCKRCKVILSMIIPLGAVFIFYLL